MSEFVEVNTADLSEKALDYMTAKAAEVQMFEMGDKWPGNAFVTEATRVNPAVIVDQLFNLYFEASMRSVRWSPSTDWSQCGPLMDCFKIEIIRCRDAVHAKVAGKTNAAGYGDTALIAACRAIVASVLGENVSVPKELCHE